MLSQMIEESTTNPANTTNKKSSDYIYDSTLSQYSLEKETNFKASNGDFQSDGNLQMIQEESSQLELDNQEFQS